MTAFRAVTKTGTVYTYNGFTLRIDSDRSGISVFRPSVLAQFPHGATKDWERVDWDYLKGLPQLDGLPEVGMHIYAAGREEWRISTPVVSVEEIEEA